ncbi:MAG: hypothetical protein ABI580_03355 [Burkholderiaceae bacterium]
MKQPTENGFGGNASILLLLTLTLLNIVLQISSAALIKVAAILSHPGLTQIAMLLALVFSLNMGRFMVWNAIHKRYPVSLAYPVSALFFPAVVGLAWFMDEPIGVWQVVGTFMVMAGVSWILLPEKNSHRQPIIDA